MSIELQFEDRPDHLYVIAAGEWTEEGACDAIDNIYAAATARGASRILIDIRQLSEPRTEMVRYFTGLHIAKVWKPPLRAAAVGREEMLNRFAETVAVNRGAMYAVFTTDEAALDWLLAEEDPLTDAPKT